MDGLTTRQAEILQLIQDHIIYAGFPPTRAEIAEKLGFRSINAAEDHLKALERKGVIEILPGTSRGIRLRQGSGLPVIGRVISGQPILSEPHINFHYQLDSRLFKPRAHYLLKMLDLSMGDAGIFEGDLLAVHRTRNARNGQVVIARIKNEITVRRFKRKWKNQVWLLPANSGFEAIVIDSRDHDFIIEGIAVGVIRQEINQ